MMRSDNWRSDRNRHRLIIDTSYKQKNTISYGLIVFAKDTQKYLLVRRKHSIDFLFLIKGSYRKTQLPFILNKITNDEAQTIKLLTEKEKFEKYFLDELGLDEKDLEYAYGRFVENLNIIQNILNKYVLNDNKLSWNWPKGRLNSFPKETPFNCALREFKEEVGINIPPYSYKSDKIFSEKFKSFYGRVIESKYWLYIIDEEFSLPKIDDSNKEISEKGWFTYDECKNMLNSSALLEEVSKIIC